MASACVIPYSITDVQNPIALILFMKVNCTPRLFYWPQGHGNLNEIREFHQITVLYSTVQYCTAYLTEPLLSHIPFVSDVNP